MHYRNEWGELEHPTKNTKFLERDNLYDAMQYLDETINNITTSEVNRTQLTMAAYVLYNTACSLWYNYHVKAQSKAINDIFFDESDIDDDIKVVKRPDES